MKKIVFIVLCVFAGTVRAQEPSYEVHRVATPIVIDGVVSAEEWGAASPAIEYIFPWDSQTGAKQITRARLLWDDTNLYVAYECEDTDIYAQYLERDDWVYRDDTVEIFLNVVPSQIDAYYGLEMNVRGVFMDYLCTSSQYYHKPYQFQGVRICSHIDGTLNMRGDTDTGWSLEAAIPWANFSTMSRKGPEVGTVYTANLTRWDGVDPDRRLSVWSDSQLDWPHPHAPEHFGELIFVE